MVTQGAFNLLFRPGLRKDFRDEWNEYAPEYPEYLRVDTVDRADIEATVITGMRLLLERGDGEPVTFEDPKIGPKVVATDKEFALGFMITRRTVEDDLYKKANQAARWLAHAARMTSEYRSAALLDDAAAGATFKGLDGLSLINTTHTLFGSTAGTTMANRPTQDIGFSVTGMTALLDLHQLHKDWNGDPIKTMPDTIIYSPQKISKAIQIFESSQEPFTAENQDNAVRKRLPGIKHVVSHFKALTESYFLVDSKLNDAHYAVRRPVEFDDTFDFMTDAALYKTTTRFIVWFADFHGWTAAFPT
jgi:hypothetical protein